MLCCKRRDRVKGLQVYANKDLLITDKYSGKVAYRVAQAGAKEIDQCDPCAPHRVRMLTLHRLQPFSQ